MSKKKFSLLFLLVVFLIIGLLVAGIFIYTTNSQPWPEPPIYPAAQLISKQEYSNPKGIKTIYEVDGFKDQVMSGFENLLVDNGWNDPVISSSDNTIFYYTGKPVKILWLYYFPRNCPQPKLDIHFEEVAPQKVRLTLLQSLEECRSK